MSSAGQNTLSPATVKLAQANSLTSNGGNTTPVSSDKMMMGARRIFMTTGTLKFCIISFVLSSSLRFKVVG